MSDFDFNADNIMRMFDQCVIEQYRLGLLSVSDIIRIDFNRCARI